MNTAYQPFRVCIQIITYVTIGYRKANALSYIDKNI